MNTLVLPNAFNDHDQKVEQFYDALADLPSDEPVVFDMRDVTFMRPYGVIALVMAARYLFAYSGERVVLRHIQDRVHPYLERVNLFHVAEPWLRDETPLTDDARWERAQQKPKLLELTRVSSATDMVSVITQAEQIFSYWLHSRNLHNLINVLSELCANVYQHSGDPDGLVLIQTHEAVTKGQARVRVAIGDLGRGVRRNLSGRFGVLGRDMPLDYLTEAMSGRTSRATGRGGLGLRIVEQTVGEGGGYLWLRSETAAICSTGPGQAEGQGGLVWIGGTQVGVDFHASLPDEGRAASEGGAV